MHIVYEHENESIRQDVSSLCRTMIKLDNTGPRQSLAGANGILEVPSLQFWLREDRDSCTNKKLPQFQGAARCLTRVEGTARVRKEQVLQTGYMIGIGCCRTEYDYLLFPFEVKQRRTGRKRKYASVGIIRSRRLPQMESTSGPRCRSRVLRPCQKSLMVKL